MITTLALFGLTVLPIVLRVAPSARLVFGFKNDASEREALVRVRAALDRSGVDVGALSGECTSSAPLDGTGSLGVGSLDFAFALLYAAHLGAFPMEALADVVAVGSLTLQGELRHTNGITSVVRAAAKLGKTLIIPEANQGEAAAARARLAAPCRVLVARELKDVIEHLRGNATLRDAVPLATLEQVDSHDMSRLYGNYACGRALEVAAAGGHNVLFFGPKGNGTHMMARALVTILPEMTPEERDAVTETYSSTGLLPHHGYAMTRPFRAPHHTVSPVALVGGGSPLRPGEASLAHNGVLYLEDVVEFRLAAIEALRDPMDHGSVSFRRTVAGEVVDTSYPAKPVVVMAANRCPCGFHGAAGRACECTDAQRASYRARLAKMLRYVAIEAHPRIPERGAAWERSEVVRERVTKARQTQAARCSSGLVKAPTNDAMSWEDIAVAVQLPADAATMLEQAGRRLGFDGKSQTAKHVLRLTRTIADLAGKDIHAAHLAEALTMVPRLTPVPEEKIEAPANIG